MWKKIKDSNYYLLLIQEDEYELYVTDYISIWNTFFTPKTFLAQVVQSNDGLELENNSEFIHKGLHLLSNPDKLKKHTILKEDDGGRLSIHFSIAIGYLFYFECKLSKGPEELFFQKITQPLLKTINNLRSSETQLRHLLIKKDKEIEEYKCEGGEIVLRHLKTVAFDDDEHMKKYEAYEEFFGSAGLSSILLEQKVNVQHNNETQTKTVKEEPNLLKYSSHLPKILEEPTPSHSTEEITMIPPINCKQEFIKTEPVPENKRKRLRKLNY